MNAVIAELLIKNVPEYAKEYPLWVVTPDEINRDVAWFFGAWDDDEQISDVINQTGGEKIIVHNPRYKG